MRQPPPFCIFLVEARRTLVDIVSGRRRSLPDLVVRASSEWERKIEREDDGKDEEGRESQGTGKS